MNIRRFLPLIIIFSLIFVAALALPAFAFPDIGVRPVPTGAITCYDGDGTLILNDARFEWANAEAGVVMIKDGVGVAETEATTGSRDVDAGDTATHTWQLRTVGEGTGTLLAEKTCEALPPPPPAPPAPPVDSDGDGVYDDADLCPDGYDFGFGWDAYGCGYLPPNPLANWNGDPNSPSFDGRMNTNAAAEYVLFCKDSAVQVWHAAGYLVDAISFADVSALDDAGQSANMAFGMFAIGRNGGHLTVQQLGGGFSFDMLYAACIN